MGKSFSNVISRLDILGLIISFACVFTSPARAETIPATPVSSSSQKWSAGKPVAVFDQYGRVTNYTQRTTIYFTHFQDAVRNFCTAEIEGLTYTWDAEEAVPAGYQYWSSCTPAPDIPPASPPPTSCGFQCYRPLGINSPSWQAQIFGSPDYICPTGGNWTLAGTQCVRPDCTENFTRDGAGQCIPDPPGTDGPSPRCEDSEGNPINAANGRKFEQQIFALPGPGAPPISFSLTYFSPTGVSAAKFRHGAGWMAPWDKRLILSQDADRARSPYSVSSRRADGSLRLFTRAVGETYIPSLFTQDVLLRLFDASGYTSGWIYKDLGVNALETYDRFGTLLGVTFADGRGFSTYTTLMNGRNYAYGVYDNANYRAVNDTSSSIWLSSSISVRGVVVAQLAYDFQGNLDSLTWPDGRLRQFKYEDSRWPSHLTGVVDENGDRFATWAYDVAGRAVRSFHGSGADDVNISYATGSSTSTDSLGAARVRSIQKVNGISRSTSRLQPGGSGCDSAAAQTAFNADGTISQQDDYNGNRTCFYFDPLSQMESSRIEGLASTAVCTSLATSSTIPAGSRRISSKWHPTWRLRIAEAGPGRKTTNVYNGQPDPFASNAIAQCAPASAVLPTGIPIAPLCKIVEEATLDSNGQTGFAALVDSSKAPRRRSWTYNDKGQPLTFSDPLSNITTYTYSSGDLLTASNAAGQATQYSNFDSLGRIRNIAYANGSSLSNVYSATRGWLLSSTLASSGLSETTSYSYDFVGQLKMVTLPDGTVVSYDYDSAHRLTKVTDQAGNSISYTLDNAGNRLQEETKDPGGTLARSITRAFDALGRVQQVTGAPK